MLIDETYKVKRLPTVHFNECLFKGEQRFLTVGSEQISCQSR